MSDIDQDLVRSIVDQIEMNLDKLAQERSTYMNACKPFHGANRDLYDKAKEAGITRSSMRAMIKERQLQKKIAKNRDELEVDDRAQMDAMREALGPFADTELGRFAVEGVTATIIPTGLSIDAREFGDLPDPAAFGPAKPERKKRAGKKSPGVTGADLAELEGLADGPSDDIPEGDDARDLRPRFMHDVETPPDVPAAH